jgi:hypothetical protein
MLIPEPGRIAVSRGAFLSRSEGLGIEPFPAGVGRHGVLAIGLDYCPYCNPDSRNQATVDSHGKIRPEALPLNHRKPDSSAQSTESELRPREYLTEKEIERLQDAARKRSRYGHRDATMILISFRHGLRASEVCGLRWDQIDLNKRPSACPKSQRWDRPTCIR